MRIETNFNNGLAKNFPVLREAKLYKKGSSGSYFKYIYDKLHHGAILEQPVSTVIGYEDNKPIAVLLFFHSVEPYSQQFNDFTYLNIGTIGIIVKEEYRGLGYAKKLLSEFEKNFIELYSFSNDYILVNALEDAYPVAYKSFKWFIPCRKENSSHQEQEHLLYEINNGRRTLKRYLYEKRRKNTVLF